MELERSSTLRTFALNVAIVLCASICSAAAFFLVLKVARSERLVGIYSKIASSLPLGEWRYSGIHTSHSPPYVPVDLAGWLGAITVMAIVFVIVHTLVFLGVDQFYRRFGWPPYWRSSRENGIRTMPTILHAWGRSAISVVYAFPLSGLAWIIWYSIYSSSLRNETIPIMRVDGLSVLTLNSGALLILVIACARTIRRDVMKKIEDAQYRCASCAYLLRDRLSRICPECGRAAGPCENINFVGARILGKLPRGVLRTAQIALVVMLFCAPMIIPFVRRTLDYLTSR